MKKWLDLKYLINWTLYLNYFNLWLILRCIALILYIGYLGRYTEMCVYVYKMYIKCNIGRNLELACIFFYWELFQGTLKWPISHTNEHYITKSKLILHCTQASRLTKFVCIIYKKNTFFSIFVENCSIYMYLIFSVCSVLVRKKCIYLKSGTLLNIHQQYPSML